jgi:cytochrome c2
MSSIGDTANGTHVCDAACTTCHKAKKSQTKK